MRCLQGPACVQFTTVPPALDLTLPRPRMRAPTASMASPSLPGLRALPPREVSLTHTHMPSTSSPPPHLRRSTRAPTTSTTSRSARPPPRPTPSASCCPSGALHTQRLSELVPAQCCAWWRALPASLGWCVRSVVPVGGRCQRRIKPRMSGAALAPACRALQPRHACTCLCHARAHSMPAGWHDCPPCTPPAAAAPACLRSTGSAGCGSW